MAVLGVFSLGLGILLVFMHILLILGIFLEWRRQLCRQPCPPQGGAAVSVIIPVRNEGPRMEGMLRSLLAQDYPAQIIFIDDRSDDEGPAMLAAFAQEAAARGIDCKIITLRENPGPNCKQYALSKGIAQADGALLLFTDGDCQMPPNWAGAMAGAMGDAQTGALIGPVFREKRGKGFLHLYQCADHALRYTYLAGATGLGAAGGGFGNNLIVRKAALEAAGGYGAVPPSPTEDAALVAMIRPAYRVRAMLSSDAAVETAPEPNWRSFMSQTLRWNKGGLFSRDRVTRRNYNLLSLIILLGVLAAPFLPLLPALWPLPAGVLISIALGYAAAFFLFGKNLPFSALSLPGYALALLLSPAHFALAALLNYCRVKVRWKGKIV